MKVQASMNMKIGILGAGAMGQLFGGRLRLAGNDVIFIDAAPATIEALTLTA